MPRKSMLQINSILNITAENKDVNQWKCVPQITKYAFPN